MGSVLSKQTCTLQPGGLAIAGADGVFVVKASSCCCSTAVCGGGGELTLCRREATTRLHRRRGMRLQRAEKTIFGSSLVREFRDNGKFLGKAKTKKAARHPNLPQWRREVDGHAPPPSAARGRGSVQARLRGGGTESVQARARAEAGQSRFGIVMEKEALSVLANDLRESCAVADRAADIIHWAVVEGEKPETPLGSKLWLQELVFKMGADPRAAAIAYDVMARRRQGETPEAVALLQLSAVARVSDGGRKERATEVMREIANSTTGVRDLDFRGMGVLWQEMKQMADAMDDVIATPTGSQALQWMVMAARDGLTALKRKHEAEAAEEERKKKESEAAEEEWKKKELEAAEEALKKKEEERAVNALVVADPGITVREFARFPANATLAEKQLLMRQATDTAVKRMLEAEVGEANLAVGFYVACDAAGRRADQLEAARKRTDRRELVQLVLESPAGAGKSEKEVAATIARMEATGRLVKGEKEASPGRDTREQRRIRRQVVVVEKSASNP
jgi:hypothetical protein